MYFSPCIGPLGDPAASPTPWRADLTGRRPDHTPLALPRSAPFVHTTSSNPRPPSHSLSTALTPLVGWPAGSSWGQLRDAEQLPEVQVEVADEETTRHLIQNWERRKNSGFDREGLAGTWENPLVGVYRMSTATAHQREEQIRGGGLQERAKAMVKEWMMAGGQVRKRVLIMVFFHIGSLNQEVS